MKLSKICEILWDYIKTSQDKNKGAFANQRNVAFSEKQIAIQEDLLRAITTAISENSTAYSANLFPYRKKEKLNLKIQQAIVFAFELSCDLLVSDVFEKHTAKDPHQTSNNISCDANFYNKELFIEDLKTGKGTNGHKLLWEIYNLRNAIELDVRLENRTLNSYEHEKEDEGNKYITNSML